jgi:hypothetical protein
MRMTKKFKSLNDDQLNSSGGEFSISGIGKKVIQVASVTALVCGGALLEEQYHMIDKAASLAKKGIRRIID